MFELNTAKALLEAGNFDGARRKANEALDVDPDDNRAKRLLVEIEFGCENYKRQLELSREFLSTHPNNVEIRLYEFLALSHLKKKSEARKAYNSFKTDFPDHDYYLSQMELVLNALTGETRQTGESVRTRLSEAHSDNEKIDLGLTCLKLGDIFIANRALTEVHDRHPHNFEIVTGLASANFQICKFNEARKFALRALKLDPKNWRLKIFILLSYIAYFPPFLLIVIFLSLFRLMKLRYNKYAVVVIFSLSAYFCFGIGDFFYGPIGVLIGVRYNLFDWYLNIMWLMGYAFIIQYLGNRMIDKKSKPVRLRRF